MKFKFKVQSFQTEATDSIVKVFDGQPLNGVLKYRRDLGNLRSQISLDEQEEEFDLGYKNPDITIDKEQLLKNIQKIKVKNNISIPTELKPRL